MNILIGISKNAKPSYQAEVTVSSSNEKKATSTTGASTTNKSSSNKNSASNKVHPLQSSNIMNVKPDTSTIMNATKRDLARVVIKDPKTGK